jgi:hypothetical protein
MSNFLSFCEDNNRAIIHTIGLASLSIPISMNGIDHRFDISHIFCRSLHNAFPNDFEVIDDEDYDMVYRNDVKISIKIMKGDVFQRQDMRTSNLMTSSKPIIIRNTQGESQKSLDIDDYNFDYLMVIQRAEIDLRSLGFALIRRDRMPPLEKRSSQIMCRISNNEWDYYSGLYSLVYSDISDVSLHYIEIEKMYREWCNRNYDNLLSHRIDFEIRSIGSTVESRRERLLEIERILCNQ